MRFLDCKTFFAILRKHNYDCKYPVSWGEFKYLHSTLLTNAECRLFLLDTLDLFLFFSLKRENVAATEPI